jgi:hypothetical protein
LRPDLSYLPDLTDPQDPPNLSDQAFPCLLTKSKSKSLPVTADAGR